MSHRNIEMMTRFGHSSPFIAHVSRKLYQGWCQDYPIPRNFSNLPGPSAVLFLLGENCDCSLNGFDPCLLLNKRSDKVRQPGDLCCPGGRISPKIDAFLAKICRLPGFPLARWPYWKKWQIHHGHRSQRLSVLLATGLREGLEEMRLNPMGLTFMGPLPVEQLVIFPREIFPMVSWINNQKRFYPNWEVDKLVYVPLRELLDPGNYARYRLHIKHPPKNFTEPTLNDYPCFIHGKGNESELLWGATYRITVAFLEIVFTFTPPDPEQLPVVNGSIGKKYVKPERPVT